MKIFRIFFSLLLFVGFIKAIGKDSVFQPGVLQAKKMPVTQQKVREEFKPVVYRKLFAGLMADIAPKEFEKYSALVPESVEETHIDQPPFKKTRIFSEQHLPEV